MAETRIILVQHDEVERGSPARFRGRADLALTSQGFQQAELTRDYLHCLGVAAAIYASAQSQCQQTAHILAAPHYLTPGYTPALDDIDYGEWQGRSYDDIRQCDPERFKIWMTNPEKAEIPNGEPLLTVSERASRAWRMALARHPGATTILVSHESIGRLLLLNLLHLPLDRYWSFEQTPCGVSVTSHDGLCWKIRSMNETAQLVRTPSSTQRPSDSHEGLQPAGEASTAPQGEAEAQL